MKKLLYFVLLVFLLAMLCGCVRLTGDPYTVADDFGKEWTIDPEEGTITDGEHTYEFSIRGDSKEYKLFITYPDGNRYTETKIGDTMDGSYKRQTSSWLWSVLDLGGVYLLYQPSGNGFADGEELAQLLRPLVPEYTAPKDHTISILLIVLGFVDLMWPKVFWFLRYGMDFRDVEPTKRARILQNVAGVVVMAVGILLLFV